MKVPRAGASGALVLLLAAGAGAVRGEGPEVPVQAPARDPFEASRQRLQSLVDAAEKALAEKDEAKAAVRVEEAEALVADWVLEDLKRPEVVGILDRLRAVQARMHEGGAPPEPEPGLKVDEEVVSLTGEDLKAELNQVQKAEEGALFDFPIDLNDKVLTWVKLFTTSRKGFIEGALSRASQFLPMVRQVFAEEGIPLDLAYLGVIESGYKNTARSRAQAVGMWQFIRSSGRIYGLTGNAWVEERRDPIKSTRAAARYLRRLYEATGDWYLALIGYNAGPMTTERGVQGTGSRNFWDLARSRYLRNETKNYVPELCAAILIGRFPERYGLSVSQLPPYAYETVEVDRMTSLSVLAHFAGTDVQALKELNPELVRATTPPGRYTLRVPPGTGAVTQRALASIPAGQRLDFKAYVVRKGDTVARVASKFQVSPEDLLATNNISRSQFRPGVRLQVPPKSPVPISDLDLRSKADRDRHLGDRPLEPIPRLPATDLSAPLPSTGGRPAATPDLPGPGRQDGIRQAEPPKADASTPGAPVPGAPRVETPKPEPPKPEATRPEPSAAREPASRREAATRFTVHKVKKGETVGQIAHKYHVTVPQLRAWNGLRKDRIAEGQSLRIRVH